MIDHIIIHGDKNCLCREDKTVNRSEKEISIDFDVIPESDLDSKTFRLFFS